MRNIWSIAQRTCNRVRVKVRTKVRVRGLGSGLGYWVSFRVMVLGYGWGYVCAIGQMRSSFAVMGTSWEKVVKLNYFFN